MLRGQITLLPNSRDGGAVAALRSDYAALYVLTDDDAESGLDPCFTYPVMRPTGTESRVPAFPPDRIAAVLFMAASSPSWAAAALIAVSSIAGAQLGAAVARRIPDRVLRAIVVIGGLTIGIVLAVR